MSTNNPEIGKRADLGGYEANYLEAGSRENPTVILLHGSGPGVTGYANWRLLMPQLENDFHVLAPDVIGFGYTDHPEGYEYNMTNWLKFTCDFMDAVGVSKAHFVGNSFGGALSLAMAARHPERVDRFVMMGAAGIRFEMTEGLREVWGYKPSVEAMRSLMSIFAYRQDLVSEEIIQSRYEASIRPGYQEAYEQLFPEPMQEKLDGLSLPEEEIAKISHPALLVHGREDVIVPMENSIKGHKLLKNSELHIYGECGHWTQVEKPQAFAQLVKNFLS
ncbi:putative hydrolase or acyltransferase of alpha/beta superfamily [Spongiibacter sp. IMCC21906]|uniref:alpha/beta fold hydrolase n=1 Tax=Spongiibacter sp. IMCC21906 TaxID=1620392 RepID=UPI00062DF61D|nr:alpha/beta hydrolase [Spongiibacter sp. IMCC21906]AKH70361.1 putative hydrolase or acyltransferase of alpha/beta superfamily [Spongiibacter sp. IMCC21906]